MGGTFHWHILYIGINPYPVFRLWATVHCQNLTVESASPKLRSQEITQKSDHNFWTYRQVNMQTDTQHDWTHNPPRILPSLCARPVRGYPASSIQYRRLGGSSGLHSTTLSKCCRRKRTKHTRKKTRIRQSLDIVAFKTSRQETDRSFFHDWRPHTHTHARTGPSMHREVTIAIAKWQFRYEWHHVVTKKTS